MARKYRQYSDQDILISVKKAKSIADLLRKLDLKVVGGNYINIKRNLQRLKADTRHWTGRGWNKGEQLKDYSQYTKVEHAKKHLMRKRGHQCETCCGRTWFKKPIPLEIHHKNGDRGNNAENNLSLLCPNCHAFTDTWRGKRHN